MSVTKHVTKASQGKKVYFDLHFEAIVYARRKAWWQQLEVAGCVMFCVRKRDECQCSAHFLTCTRYVTQPKWRCCPHSEWVFHSQQNLSGNNLPVTARGMFTCWFWTQSSWQWRLAIQNNEAAQNLGRRKRRSHWSTQRQARSLKSDLQECLEKWHCPDKCKEKK